MTSLLDNRPAWPRTGARATSPSTNPDQAIEAFGEAVLTLPAAGDRRGARIQVGLARAHLGRGDADEALRQASGR